MGVKARLSALLAATAALALISGPVSAQISTINNAAEAQIDANFSGGRILFESRSRLTNYSVRVVGPDGYVGELQSARTAPSFRLADFGEVPDGQYTYEIFAATSEIQRSVRRAAPGENGRDVSSRPRVGTSSSGSFHVRNGQIIEFDTSAEEG